MILLLQRLFNRQMRTIWIPFIIVGVASVLTITISCWPHHIYQDDYDSRCSNDWYRWLVVVILDVLTEFVLLVLSLYHVRRVQMDRKPKAKVMLSFASRVLYVLEQFHPCPPTSTRTSRTQTISFPSRR